MSRTVCSWCKAPLVLKDDILVCSNTDCPACDEKYLHEALNRTRKALEIAIYALKRIGASYPRITDIAMQDKASQALEQITVLKKSELENLEMLVNNVFK